MRGVALLIALVCGAPLAIAAEAPALDQVVVEAGEAPLRVRLSATPASPRPGVAVDLRIEAESAPDPSIEIEWPDLREALTASLGEHVVEVESVRLAPDRRSLEARLRLYDEGTHELPPLTVRARLGDDPLGEVVLEGASLEVDVDVPEGAAPAPEREPLPLEVPPPPFPWLGVALAAVLLAVLAVMAALWRRRARVAPPPPPPPPPHEKALAALRALASRSLPERGEVEPYFVELSEILRTYLEERFGLRAPEQTTEEFLASVSRSASGRQAIEEAHREVLRDFLTRADLVKFARARPAAPECAAAGEGAERFVRETAPAEPAAGEGAET